MVSLPLLIRTLIPSGGFILMTSSRPNYPQGSHVQIPSCCRLGLPHVNRVWGDTSSDNPNLGLHARPGAGRRPLMGSLLQTLLLPIRKLILGFSGLPTAMSPYLCVTYKSYLFEGLTFKGLELDSTGSDNKLVLMDIYSIKQCFWLLAVTVIGVQATGSGRGVHLQ